MQTVVHFIDEEERLTTLEAISYLRKKYPWLKEATFYQRVSRSKGIPHKKLGGYSFTKEELDKMWFRTPKEYTDEYGVFHTVEHVQPIEVHSSDDLLLLSQRYDSPIVDTKALLNAIYLRFGYKYKSGAIKQRRNRHTPPRVVGVAGVGKRQQYWYVLNDIYSMRFQPHTKE